MSTERDFRKVKSPGKFSYVQAPVRVIAVAQKLSTIEERLQEQSCLFQKGDYRIKGHNPINMS
jgi:hypothetical protein